MFKKLGKMVGMGGKSGPTPQPFEVAPADPANPVPVPQLTPFPLTGEKHAHNGYLYTTPSDMDFLVFRNLVDSVDGWTLRYARDGVYSWDKTVPGEAMRLIKAFGTFEGVPPERAYDLLQDPDYRIEWDQNRVDGFCFVHLSERTDIGYYAARAKPITTRDFVNMRSWRQCGDGEYIIMSTSVPIAEKPPVEGMVRAVVKVSGYLVRPHGNGCSITYLSQSDPKGWVPTYFVNTLTCKLAPNVLNNMRKAVAAYPQWIEKRGAQYKREWIVPDTPWPTTTRHLTHEWLEANGAAPAPVTEEVPDDEAESESPVAAAQ